MQLEILGVGGSLLGKKQSITKSTISLFGLTLFIKLLGFVKQAVLAAVYGATAETDAFYISVSIINSLCTVIFSALSVSLLSMYSQNLIQRGRKAANHLISNTLRVFLPIAVGLTFLFYAGAPLFAKLFAPSYTDEQLTLLAENIRVMSVSFVFWCYFLTLNVVAEADKHFLQGKCYALFQNLFVVVAAVVLADHSGANSLVYAFALAGLAQCILMTVSVRKSYRTTLRGRAGRGEIGLLLQMAIPLLIGNAIYEINDIVDKQIASGLGSGTVSILTYGASVNEIVTTVMIASVSTVLFSHFTAWAAQNNTKVIEDHLRDSMEYIAILTFLMLALCVACGDHIVAVLYGRGSFSQENVSVTYGVVVGYAFGFLFQAARANLVKVYYAFQDSRTPMINGAVSVAINIILSLFLSGIFGAAGIAAATSISMLVVTVLLLAGLGKYLPEFRVLADIREYVKGILAAACAAAIVWLLKSAMDTNVYVMLILEVLAGVIVYVEVLILIRSHTIRNMFDILRKIGNGR